MYRQHIPGQNNHSKPVAIHRLSPN